MGFVEQSRATNPSQAQARSGRGLVSSQHKALLGMVVLAHLDSYSDLVQSLQLWKCDSCCSLTLRQRDTVYAEYQESHLGFSLSLIESCTA